MVQTSHALLPKEYKGSSGRAVSCKNEEGHEAEISHTLVKAK